MHSLQYLISHPHRGLTIHTTLIRPVHPTAHAINVDREHIASRNVHPFVITPITGDWGIKTSAEELRRPSAAHRLSVIHIETQTGTGSTIALVRNAGLETKGADRGFGEAC